MQTQVEPHHELSIQIRNVLGVGHLECACPGSHGWPVAGKRPVAVPRGVHINSECLARPLPGHDTEDKVPRLAPSPSQLHLRTGMRVPYVSPAGRTNTQLPFVFFTERTTGFTTLCITQFFSGIPASAFSDSQKLPTLSPGILRNPSSRNPRVYAGATASRNTQFHLVLNSPSYVFLYLCWSCCCSAGARWLAPVSVHSAKTLS